MWRITLSQEATHYLEDNLSLIDALIQAIDGLSASDGGIPPEGCTQIEPGIYWWEVARHIVIYMRMADETPRLRISVIKPIE